VFGFISSRSAACILNLTFSVIACYGAADKWVERNLGGLGGGQTDRGKEDDNDDDVFTQRLF
jgi:hypothetical protein